MISSNPSRACLLSAVVAVALALTGAPAFARTPHGLTLRTAAGTLAPGAALSTPGGTLAISSVKGAVECPSTELSGSLGSNGLSTDTFSSSIETGSLQCTNEWPAGAGGVAEVAIAGRQEDTISAKGKGSITEARGESPMRVDIGFPAPPPCEYTAKGIEFRFAAGAAGAPQPVVLEGKRLLKPMRDDAKGCPMMAILHVTLPLAAETASGEYEAVESEAG